MICGVQNVGVVYDLFCVCVCVGSLGNLWREIWETAKLVPAVKQSPLYDEDLSV